MGKIVTNNRVACQKLSWVAHYFSNSFQKLAGNEYCSKLRKRKKLCRKRIQVSGHVNFEHLSFFSVSPGYLNLNLNLN